MTYCSTLTDRQLENVIELETKRKRNNPPGTDSHSSAVEMLLEAYAELARRNS